MTREEVLKLEGRALDAAVAEKVCRWDRCGGEPDDDFLERHGAPFYHSDLNAVTEAERRLRYDEGCRWAARLVELVMNDGVKTYPHTMFGIDDLRNAASADATTRCRALLLAIQEGEK